MSANSPNQTLTSAGRTLRSVVPTQSATTIPGPSAANVKRDIALEVMEGPARVREPRSIYREGKTEKPASRLILKKKKKKKEHC